jgi:hypothetical protein
MLVVELEKCREIVLSLRFGGELLEKDWEETATVLVVANVTLGWTDAEDLRRRAGTLNISR